MISAATWIVAALLTSVGLAAIWCGPIIGLDPQSAATFGAALLGGAAVIFGTAFERGLARRDQEANEAARRRKVVKLVTAELVNVAAGLIGAKETLVAALDTVSGGGHLPDRHDFTSDMPRSMPFTSSLTADLFLLTEREIDILTTLQANLAVTRKQMDDISQGRRPFGRIAATALNNGVAHDMGILAEAFEALAPQRQLALAGGDLELASALLRRLAGEPRFL